MICTGCQLDKPPEEFSVRSDRPEQRRRRCRACVSTYSKGVYGAKRSSYLANNLKNKRVRREELREVVRSAKDRPCEDCGNKYPHFVMEFDHVRGEKIGNIADLVGRGQRSAVLAEIKKCDVVCANCHRVRTFGRGVAQMEERSTGGREVRGFDPRLPE